MTTSIASQLRDLVIKSPRDMGVRSVYADALIQANDPRGTYISLQMHLDGRLSPDKREAAKLQSAALLKAHGAEWLAPAKGWAEVRLKGGFIHAIRATLAQFLEHGANLLSIEPVFDVTLTQVDSDDLVSLAKMPELARISDLSLVGKASDKAAAAFVASPFASTLASLNFNGPSIGKAFAAAAANLRALRVLSVTGSEMGDEAVKLLASHDLPQLSRLYLARTDLTDDAMSAIASGRALEHVAVLCLGGNEGITDEGADVLAKAKSLGSVRQLELNQTGIGDDGASALGKSKALKALRKLDLRDTEVSVAAIKKMRKPGLTVLGRSW